MVSKLYHEIPKSIVTVSSVSVLATYISPEASIFRALLPIELLPILISLQVELIVTVPLELDKVMWLPSSKFKALLPILVPFILIMLFMY